MKRWIVCLCILGLFLSPFAAFAEGTTYSDLNDLEKSIFDSFVIMLEDFQSPQNVRLLGIGSYMDMSEFRDPSNELYDLLACADSIGIEVRGYNILFDQYNGYYELYISDWCHPEDGEQAKRFIEQSKAFGTTGIKASYYSYYDYCKKGFYKVKGDDAEFGESLKNEKYIPDVSIDKINSALEVYWAELGA